MIVHASELGLDGAPLPDNMQVGECWQGQRMQRCEPTVWVLGFVALPCDSRHRAAASRCGVAAPMQRVSGRAAPRGQRAPGGCWAAPALQVMGVQTQNYVRLGTAEGQQPGSGWHGERRLLGPPPRPHVGFPPSMHLCGAATRCCACNSVLRQEGGRQQLRLQLSPAVGDIPDLH